MSDASLAGRAASGEAWLVALDVDGTILHENETLTPGVVDAIERARDRGHEIMPATGRSWRTTEPLLRTLGLTPEYVVCANGAFLLRREGQVLGADAPGYVLAHVETFDPRDVLTTIRGNLPQARFLVELPDGSRRHLGGEAVGDWDLSRSTEVAGFEELSAQPVTRVVVVSPDHEIEEFLRIVEGMGLHQVSYAVGWTSWLDIAPAGVNKATGMERVRAWLDWPRSRVIAVGDGRNDIDMFEWARLAGRAVAMGQAPDVVRSAASEVTASVLDDGLVAVLDSLP